MAEFILRFIAFNALIAIIAAILSIVKRAGCLTGSMRHRLWLIYIGLLIIPFVPAPKVVFMENPPAVSVIPSAVSEATAVSVGDFAISVSGNQWAAALFILWLAGVIFVGLLTIKSIFNLKALAHSALPLQNSHVRRIYDDCLQRLKIKKPIPIYSTAFLKSPIIAGFIRPRIYIPIHLISDGSEGLKYMLLHELIHYRRKDALVNYIVVIVKALYWFNPAVWYAASEMKTDREIACDTAVLEIIGEELYNDYGNAIISCAEKIPFAFADGVGGSMKQLKRRISCIAAYSSPTVFQKLRGWLLFISVAAMLLGTTPVLSAYALETNTYHWAETNVSYVDLSQYFGEYDGCFVLYDRENDHWSIYNADRALKRVSPNSTYKIYTALFGLEEGIISPEVSYMEWNGQAAPFEEWNTGHDLYSAMGASVNWYFQSIDESLGKKKVNEYIQKIGYGNKNTAGSQYWLQSSLKISPVEQVRLLSELDGLGFDEKNVNAVKKSMLVYSGPGSSLFGKTGTGQVDGKDINGWFIGFLENESTYFFAVSISADENANGKTASQIAMSVLNDNIPPVEISNRRDVYFTFYRRL